MEKLFISTMGMILLVIFVPIYLTFMLGCVILNKIGTSILSKVEIDE